VGSNWRLVLRRTTDSSLDFRTSLNVGIEEFLEFQFSSKSQNRSSYRYIPALADRVGLEPVSPVSDILGSLNFFNTQDRRAALFNLRSISVKLVHHLGDWDVTMEYSGAPELDASSGVSVYEWNGRFSFFVQWRPIPEMKRRVTVDDGELAL
jgi:hypothetical protein